MEKNKLFSVIVTNYNQEKYIFENINSILSQKYDNIELIITDDCSDNFDKNKIQEYIIKNNNGNIISYNFIQNKKNIGTVATINKALKMVKGNYVYLIAADDVLDNSLVLAFFAKEFENNNKYYCVSSKCYLCDENLKKINVFPYDNKLDKFNNLTSKEQNLMLRKGPVFAPGATAYRKELFEKANYYDESYILIEDWSWFLRITRLGYSVKLLDFVSMKHRGGGISEKSKMSSCLVDNILKDTYNIYKNEVFIEFNNIFIKDKIKIMDRYKFFIHAYGKININFLFIYLKYSILDFDLLKYHIKVSNKIKNFVILLFLFLLSIIVLNKVSILLLAIIIPFIFGFMRYYYEKNK